MRNPVKIQQFAMVGVLVTFGLVGGFCALEGTSSLVLLAADVLLHPVTFSRFGNEKANARYDSELGWANQANLFLPDLYGPGIFLRTNAQGFRGDQEVAREAPRDRLRVICSGDSFTFGYGVDDDHTWCHLLGSMDHRFGTVNMGENGYGIDQAYLWYARNGNSLEHAAHVFALITLDFYRIGQPRFFGYGKPMLALENGMLVTRNVPVPRSRFGFFFGPLLHRLATASERLRGAELVNRVRKRLISGGAAREETWQVAAKIFETLQRMNRAAGSTLLIVYLPTGADYMTPESDPWRERLRAESEKSGFSYLDLVPALRQLPPERMAAMFLSRTSPGGGHYSNAGNAWVAERVHDRLLRLPSVAALLARGPSTNGAGEMTP
jgi:hypothetical protein